MSWRPHNGDIRLGTHERVLHLWTDLKVVSRGHSVGTIATSPLSSSVKPPELAWVAKYTAYPFLLACNLLDLDGKTYWCKP